MAALALWALLVALSPAEAERPGERPGYGRSPRPLRGGRPRRLLVVHKRAATRPWRHRDADSEGGRADLRAQQGPDRRRRRLDPRGAEVRAAPVARATRLWSGERSGEDRARGGERRSATVRTDEPGRR